MVGPCHTRLAIVHRQFLLVDALVVSRHWPHLDFLAVVVAAPFGIAAMCLFLVNTALASLSEFLLTPIDSTNEWFLPRVRVLMLRQVLLQREFLTTGWTRKGPLLLVDLHVAF